ncbi:hypothetical protein [Mycolicibacterium sediminis]|uniref:DUF559 domain-containing protein n=1 Tax=Mycolicibacterium sediminis TaxID=1286180 RepID=A0A7I7QYP3_9MYCO|nr:hypothetical protein MSEDJ_55340 [Mycolicibacterium sediminis]
MKRIFIGSEATASGDATAYELAHHYRRILPDVFGPRHSALTLADRTTAAWLWSKREGVISGLAASALHGARWVADDAPIEVNWANNRVPAGVVTTRDTLLPGEVSSIAGMPVTTVDRTAFDLARRGPVGQAVARLDALARTTHFMADDVRAVARRHPRVRGLRRVGRLLDLVDAGAESPKETWLRLLLIDAGFPRPQTQIPVLGTDGRPRYFLDMGWEDEMIAVEYDGEEHRERTRFKRDIVRSEYLAQLRWTLIRVVAGDRPPDITRRVGRAWASR